MRANDVSDTRVTRTPPSTVDDLTRRKAALLYELELDFRKTAKTLLRHGTPSGPLLIRRPTHGREDEPDTWQSTDLRGWMIGPNTCLLESGSWVPHVVGRVHKLDKPRHNVIFGDANTKRYAREWQALSDVGVAPGAPFLRMEPENTGALRVAVSPDRAQIFDIEATPAGEVLSFTYPWGQGKPRTDILRDDLQRWVTGYLSA